MKIFFRILVVACCIHITAICRGQNLDSLKQALRTAHNDSIRCSLLFDIVGLEENDTIWPKYNEALKRIVEKNLRTETEGKPLHNYYLKLYADVFNNLGYLSYQKSNYPQAFEYWHKGLKYQEKINDRSGMASTLNNIGTGYEALGDLPKALDYFEKSVTIHEDQKNKIGVGRSLNNIGAIYIRQGNIIKGLDYLSRSLKIEEELGDKSGMASSINNIGKIHYEQGELATALVYFERGLKLHEEISNHKGSANILNSIGMIHSDRGDLVTAMNYFKKALKRNEEMEDKGSIAFTLGNMGSLLEKQNKAETALAYYKKSLQFYEETGDTRGIAVALSKLGKLYLHQNAIPNALAAARKCLEISQDKGFPEITRDAAALLKTIYQKQNKPAEALKMYELYIQMKDSVANKETRKALLKTQFQYEYEKKEAVLKEQQEKERLLANEKERQQNIIIWTVAAGLLLVIIFSIFIFNRLQLTRRQKMIIEKQKHIVEEHRKEIIDSINYAKRIQFALLASDNLLKENLPSHFVFFKPKDVVSGDFYWATPVDDGFVYVTADCTGHGVPGAFMSLLNISKLSQTINENKITRPDLILNQVRSEIIKVLNPSGSNEESKDGMDAIVCKLNLKEMKLQYAAANNSFYVIRNGAILNCQADKMPVGKGHDDNQPFTFNEIALKKDDIIYTLTDGYGDQFGGEKGKKFKSKQLEALLLSISYEPMEEQKNKIDSAFEKWKSGLEQVDDVCIIGVRV